MLYKTLGGVTIHWKPVCKKSQVFVYLSWNTAPSCTSAQQLLDACCLAKKISPNNATKLNSDGSFANLKATQDPSSPQVIRFMTFFLLQLKVIISPWNISSKKQCPKKLPLWKYFITTFFGDFWRTLRSLPAWYTRIKRCIGPKWLGKLLGGHVRCHIDDHVLY